MTRQPKLYTRFRKSSKGASSRYDKNIVKIIFSTIEQLVDEKENHILTIEAIYPHVEELLNEKHIAVFKNDLTDIIIEVMNFLIEQSDIDLYENFFENIDSELKKTLWPSVSRLNNPDILIIIIDEIYNELDNASEYNADNLAERLSKVDSLNMLTYDELLEISEKALLKLEEMNFLV